MNKLIKYTYIKGATIVFIALFFASCKDFLDRNPLTEISGPTFWKTQKDADLALAGCYARLNCNTFNFEGVYSLDVMAGDANEGAQSLGAASTGTFALGLMEAVSGGILANVYNDCYRGIGTCNFFLDNIDKVDMPDATKTTYKGEVLFLRALFYFTLTDFMEACHFTPSRLLLRSQKLSKAHKQRLLRKCLPIWMWLLQPFQILITVVEDMR
jgi:hypothetical protein